MKILLVEDEPDLGQALKKALNQKKYLVDWVQNGKEAWSCLNLQWTAYNLAIIDWLLPEMTGIEIIKCLRAKPNSLPVLMLTAKDKMEDKVMGLDAGADDYLVKPFGMAELFARLRALQRRSPQFAPQHFQRGNLILNYGTRTVYYKANQTLPLTTKEFQLLEYLFNHPNQILTSAQIRNHLWEMEEEPLSNVVAAQVRLLRRKLEAVGCKDLIETVHGVGYRFNLTVASN